MTEPPGLPEPVNPGHDPGVDPPADPPADAGSSAGADLSPAVSNRILVDPNEETDTSSADDHRS